MQKVFALKNIFIQCIFQNFSIIKDFYKFKLNNFFETIIF